MVISITPDTGRRYSSSRLIPPWVTIVVRKASTHQTPTSKTPAIVGVKPVMFNRPVAVPTSDIKDENNIKRPR